MKELLRLLAYARRYWASLAASVVLMAAAGGATAMMALLIGPIFDSVLNAAAANTPVMLYTDPVFHHRFYLSNFVPSSIHNVWTMVAFAILAVFLTKGVCDYFGNYLVNYVGFSAVTNLRDTVFDKVLKQGAEFFESHSTGRLMSSIMNDIDKVQLATSHILADLLRQTFTAVSLLLVVMTKDWRLALVEPDRAAVRGGADHAHRPAHPAHQPPHAGPPGGAEPDSAGDPQRPHGGEGVWGRTLRIPAVPRGLA